MKIVTMKEYYDEVRKFVAKHNINKVETSSYENGQYTKYYYSEDGSAGTEINRTVYEYVTVEVKGIQVKVEVKLLETEWFDTDNGTSIYMYQRY